MKGTWLLRALCSLQPFLSEGLPFAEGALGVFPSSAVGSGTGALLWASSTCPFHPSGLSHLSPTHHSSKPLTSSPFMPNSTSLETPLLASANGGAASWQDALCQSLLLLLSVCGDSSCYGLQMGAVDASAVSCVCSPWRWAPDLMSVSHPLLLLVHLGLMAFGPHLSLRTQGLILALPTLRSQTLSCVTWGRI